MTLTSANFYATSITFQNNFNATNTTSFSDGGTSNSTLTLGTELGSAGGAATPWNITNNATSGSVSFIPTTSTGLLSLSLYTSGSMSVASGASMSFSTVINDFDASHTGGITKTSIGPLDIVRRKHLYRRRDDQCRHVTRGKHNGAWTRCERDADLRLQ